MKSPNSKEAAVTALKVHQWLDAWNSVKFDDGAHRRKPEPHFYIFSLSARHLRALSGIQRRTTAGALARSQDTGIQRRHDEARSEKIADFVKYGYPWSELNETKRNSGEFNDLRKPGWLPTAIVVNILKKGDKRRGQAVNPDELIAITQENEHTAKIVLPKGISSTAWNPKLHPIEVIDGQHRLWAFDANIAKSADFELPVVAFCGLDISWQAYLFWTINITPTRINPSLAFDLYPLLRTQDWLEKFAGHSVYREARAQEIVEILWAHPKSAWYQRINMLGERGLPQGQVTQAAWIRSLMATYVKSWQGEEGKLGGLFGAPGGKHEEVLPWSRTQQAAFLVFVGNKLKEQIALCKAEWAKTLRAKAVPGLFTQNEDAAFLSPASLLNTDQGIRGVLAVTNDMCCIRAQDLEFDEWEVDAKGQSEHEAVAKALKSLEKQDVSSFLDELFSLLVSYDWRTASVDGLTEEERTAKLVFRGSGGYRELRRQLLKHLASDRGRIGKAAKEVQKMLGY
jgi:hypothetical protein